MAIAEQEIAVPELTARKIKGYGWRPDLPDPRDRIFNLEEPVKRAAALPASVDLSAKMPPIWNQGKLGACTGHGIARVLVYEALRQGETVPGLSADNAGYSRLFIYYGERSIEGTVGSDSGGQIRDGIKVVAKLGAPPEADWPYSDADPGPFQKKPPASAFADAVAHEALTYKRVLLGGPGAPIRSALAAGYPVVFGFSVPQCFETGPWDATRDPLPVPGPGEKMIGGHCVVITGYDFSRARFAVPAFQIDNSWGTGWGMGGRFWMDAAWFAPHSHLVSDLWTITSVK